MTTAVSKKIIEYYTVEGCAFNLSDERASRTIEEFGKYLFTVATTEGVEVSDIIKKRICKTLKEQVLVYETYRNVLRFVLHILENISMADRINKRAFTKLSENIAISEVYIDYIKYMLRFMESMALEECNGKHIVQNFYDNFLLNDTSRKFLVKKSNENVTAVEDNLKRTNKVLPENFGFVDGVCKYMAKLYQENVEILETNKYFYNLNKATGIAITDSTGKSFSKNLFELANIAEKAVKGMRIKKSEKALVIENITHSAKFVRSVREVILLEEANSNSYSLSKAEAINLTDNTSKAIKTLYNANIKTVENQNNKIDKLSLETIAFSEVYFDYISYMLNFIESFALKDDVSKELLRGIRETIAIAEQAKKRICKMSNEADIILTDKTRKEISKSVVELSKIVETVAKQIKVNQSEVVTMVDGIKNCTKFIRDIVEDITLVENNSKHYEINKFYRVDIKEAVKKNIHTILSESFSLKDEFVRKFLAKLKFDENISLADNISKHCGINKNELVDVSEAFIRACNAILSNIAITSGEMSLAEFIKTIDTPPEYDNFVDYKVGDYEYQRALVRFIIESVAAQAEPILYDAEIHVDIDDINDKGTVIITDTEAVTKVYYNKSYYTAPEVQITLRGGNTGTGASTPILISTDLADAKGRYFEVEIRDSSWNRAQGTISWTSKGY